MKYLFYIMSNYFCDTQVLIHSPEEFPDVAHRQIQTFFYTLHYSLKIILPSNFCIVHTEES